jgi:thiol-disulfide isomerase/thioredoxin
LMVCLTQANEDTLQIVQDGELIKLIREEPVVVALFCTDKNAESCEDFESELAGIREDFIDMMQGDGWLVKLVNSNLVAQFSPKVDAPVTVMFRRGLPVLYDGPANGELMLDAFMRCKEPAVKELTDTSFEHLTQASSGATTGDWLVLFYTDECEQCARMTAVLETLACKHKGRSNVAKVNKQTHGEKTGRRFELGIDNKPVLIFFRLQKMYSFTLDTYDVETLDNFMSGFYKNMPSKPVPIPKTPFDDIVQMCVDYMKEYPVLIGCCVAVPVLLIILFVWLLRGEEEKLKKKKKKKSTKENKDK